jgi:phosphocarrier protein
MKTAEIQVGTAHGVHLRVAGQVAKVAAAHDCKVVVSCNGCKSADGCSIMQLLTLGVAAGERVKVQVEGPDQEVVMAKLVEIFTDGAGI